MEPIVVPVQQGIILIPHSFTPYSPPVIAYLAADYPEKHCSSLGTSGFRRGQDLNTTTTAKARLSASNSAAMRNIRPAKAKTHSIKWFNTGTQPSTNCPYYNPRRSSDFGCLVHLANLKLFQDLRAVGTHSRRLHLELWEHWMSGRAGEVLGGAEGRD